MLPQVAHESLGKKKTFLKKSFSTNFPKSWDRPIQKKAFNDFFFGTS